MSIKEFARGNYELLSYAFWGFIAFVLNLTFFKFLWALGIEYQIANIITLVILKIFVFVTNKIFVFKGSILEAKTVFFEFVRFLCARMITNLVDIFGLMVFVDFFKLDIMASKITIQIIVIILNYVFNKILVFKKPDYS